MVPLWVFSIARLLRYGSGTISGKDEQVATVGKGQRHHEAHKLFESIVGEGYRPADAET